MKGLLAIKGARFDGRNTETDLMLSGHSSGAAGSSKRLGVPFDNLNVVSADSYTVRQPSPPNVATLLNNAQVEQNVSQAQSKMASNSVDGNQSVMSSGSSTIVNGSFAKGMPSGEKGTENFELPNRELPGGRGHVNNSSASKSGVEGNKADADVSAHKYWVSPTDSASNEDLVVIHVCDETRQISRDFCCKRDILVKHMKYFEKFLQENESGYDDIDISVHCDVDIFEWLMTYIHRPDRPPELDKSVVVSILISSEFLQMDVLVEHCLVHIANNLNETIRLPIDLSCISDRITNRLAALTHPRTLANTKDRKDKILNKLYKRRVELDFSRKSGARGGVRTIAASLTCCRYCGIVYLDNWAGMLSCSKSPLAIDFNGRLAKTHSSIPGWSLTAYLKSLHTAGMHWDAIYWHVWSSCQVFQVADFMVSVLETHRYTVEADGLLIRAPAARSGEPGDAWGGVDAGVIEEKGSPDATNSNTEGPDGPDGLSVPPRPSPEYTEPLDMCLSDDTEVLAGRTYLGSGETPRPDSGTGSRGVHTRAGKAVDGDEKEEAQPCYKLKVSHTEYKPAHAQITHTLNPHRPPGVLPPQIFELICSQIKFLNSNSNQNIVKKISRQVLQAAAKADVSDVPFNYAQALWGDIDGAARGAEGVADATGGANNSVGGQAGGRGRSPTGREGRAKDKTGKVMSSKSMSRPAGAGNKIGVRPAPGADSKEGSLERDRDSSTSDREGRKRETSLDSRASSNSGSGSGSDAKDDGNRRRDDNDRNTLPDRRSRSVGTLNSRKDASDGARAGRKSGCAARPGAGASGRQGMQRAVAQPGERRYRIKATTEPLKGRQMAMFKNVPPAVVRKVQLSRGSVKGVWLLPHPLQSYPRTFADSFNHVYDTGLSTNKKHEWHMDLIREYDDKRLDRWESLLVSRRSTNDSTWRSADMQRAISMHKSSTGTGSDTNASSGANGKSNGAETSIQPSKKGLYYADKGRQPVPSVILASPRA